MFPAPFHGTAAKEKEGISMKKSAILCTLLFSLLLTACGAPAEEEAVKETSYQVLDADKAEVCVISDQAAVEEMNELINSFTSGEATPRARSRSSRSIPTSSGRRPPLWRGRTRRRSGSFWR